jgi:uncharacterized protein YjiS (DUF1127 family)
MVFAMQELAYRAYAAIPDAWFPATKAAFGRVIVMQLRWADRVRNRRMLAELDERMLRDIGLSCFDVQRETDKPFWRS